MEVSAAVNAGTDCERRATLTVGGVAQPGGGCVGWPRRLGGQVGEKFHRSGTGSCPTVRKTQHGRACAWSRSFSASFRAPISRAARGLRSPGFLIFYLRMLGFRDCHHPSECDSLRFTDRFFLRLTRAFRGSVTT